MIEIDAASVVRASRKRNVDSFRLVSPDQRLGGPFSVSADCNHARQPVESRANIS